MTYLSARAVVDSVKASADSLLVLRVRRGLAVLAQEGKSCKDAEGLAQELKRRVDESLLQEAQALDLETLKGFGQGPADAVTSLNDKVFSERALDIGGKETSEKSLGDAHRGTEEDPATRGDRRGAVLGVGAFKSGGVTGDGQQLFVPLQGQIEELLEIVESSLSPASTMLVHSLREVS